MAINTHTGKVISPFVAENDEEAAKKLSNYVTEDYVGEYPPQSAKIVLARVLSGEWDLRTIIEDAVKPR